MTCKASFVLRMIFDPFFLTISIPRSFIDSQSYFLLILVDLVSSTFTRSFSILISPFSSFTGNIIDTSNSIKKAKMLLLLHLTHLINQGFHSTLHNHRLLLLLFLFLLTNSSSSTTTATSSPDDTSSFIYVGCSQTKYTPNSQYATKLNSLLTSLLNSATYSYYNNYTTTPISALFQCRPDLSTSTCTTCITHAVSQLTTVLCPNSVGAVIQLDGCYVRYDNTTFLGVEDTTVVESRCGTENVGDYGDQVESVMNQLMGGGDVDVMFRVREVGSVKGVALCVGDLNVGQCQDCVGQAVRLLKTGCGMANSGDVFLSKCYARFVVAGGGGQRNGGNGNNNEESIQDNETEKTLAILIGIIAAVALLVFFLAFLRKAYDGKGGK